MVLVKSMLSKHTESENNVDVISCLGDVRVGPMLYANIHALKQVAVFEDNGNKNRGRWLALKYKLLGGEKSYIV